MFVTGLFQGLFFTCFENLEKDFWTIILLKAKHDFLKKILRQVKLGEDGSQNDYFVFSSKPFVFFFQNLIFF